MQKKISLFAIKNNLPEALGMVISLAGLAVIAGWFFNIGLLKSILPTWVSMKFSTAISFFLSGISIYLIARFQKQDREFPLVFLPIISMIILLLMTSLLASTIIGVSIGVEDFCVKDSMQAIGSVTPGRPSVATMINFILISITGITISYFPNKFYRILIISGTIIGLIGLTAILGYIFNQPLFYFAVTGKSSAMALLTAILFFLWGSGAILVTRNK